MSQKEIEKEGQKQSVLEEMMKTVPFRFSG